MTVEGSKRHRGRETENEKEGRKKDVSEREAPSQRGREKAGIRKIERESKEQTRRDGRNYGA